MKAYVAMIPKASGGTRPQDQRPITVWDVIYRIWANGLNSGLSGADLGSDSSWCVSRLCRHGVSSSIWYSPPRSAVARLDPPSTAAGAGALAGFFFDLEKCFLSLPWWGLFGVSARVGVDAQILQCLRSFYRQLRHRFRYGQVDGSEWFMANGLAQGCPASPDLMNILFEPFHRWAAAQDKGVSVANYFVASVSFAADVTLVATSLEELRFFWWLGAMNGAHYLVFS